MSPSMGMLENFVNGFPRVSGDEPALEAVGKPNRTFSPREWG